MELRVLKYFLMVAREENITRAAGLLHVTQPTLSRQLIQLEEELGVTLFRRSKHNILLTNDGMLLKRRAQELVELAEKTEQELSHREETLAGEIAIGCGETCGMAHLAELMVAFREKHPLVQYRVYSATADDIKERIEKGLLDLGLLIEPVELKKYEMLRFPLRERWGILTRRDSPLAEKAEICPSDLLHTPLLLPVRGEVREELAGWFGSCFEQVTVAACYNLLINAAIMVKHHVGTALCFDLGTTVYDELCFVPLSTPIRDGVVLVWKKSAAASQAVERFIQEARNAEEAFSEMQ